VKAIGQRRQDNSSAVPPEDKVQFVQCQRVALASNALEEFDFWPWPQAKIESQRSLFRQKNDEYSNKK